MVTKSVRYVVNDAQFTGLRLNFVIAGEMSAEFATDSPAIVSNGYYGNHTFRLRLIGGTRDPI